MMVRDVGEFDTENQNKLRRLWFVGDVHGDFKPLAEALLKHHQDGLDMPTWVIFLGDIEIDHRPFREILEPLRRNFPSVRAAFIYGNHDADTHEHWACLHDCGDAVPLHGVVTDLDGIKVAGLGGNFLGRVWYPPGEIKFKSKKQSMHRGAFQFRGGQQPNSSFHAAIYPDDVDHLSRLRADILVTHEAPACHPYGFKVLDDLARSMRVVRLFHGHQHDDRTNEYRLQRDELGFDAVAVDFCGIKNGLGEIIHKGPEGW
jgi:predicted phosphodiesterase